MKNKLIYVIQRHEAKRLHFDLRLQFNNVLKSWAIPKGPPNTPNKKFLAIQVDDHDISYADFSGIIPEGEYGAGKVMIWDKGSYELESLKPDKKIVFNIKGKKLKGRYCLLHFRPKEKNWLFFKIKDK
jgi:DNA ligase D-like protein (predicted 3'-phosphoesterase)